MVINPVSRKLTSVFKILPQYESNVGVDEFGCIKTIVTNHTNSCLLCAHVLNFYQ